MAWRPSFEEDISNRDEPLARVDGRYEIEARLLKTALNAGALLNVHRWFMGDISGEEAVDNITALGLTIAGALSGAASGSAVGSLFGPFGTVIGGAIGLYTGYKTAQALGKLLTDWLFGHPVDVAVDKAYEFLEVSKYASNAEINASFERLGELYNPKNGGNQNNWTRLQYYMAVIREHRGEGNL